MTSVTVVGAGVFGASTARELARRGIDVTLVEQYTPGTVRSGSGGDTRLSRAAHGGVEWYTLLSQRARTLWLELQEETGTRIWEPVGVAWFAQSDDGFEATSRVTLEAAGVPCEWLSPDDARDAVSVARRSTICTPCSTSPTRACCTRGAQHSCSSTTAIRHGVRFETARGRRGRRATGRRRRLGLRRLAAEALPGATSTSGSRAATSSSSAPTARGAAHPGSATTTRRSTVTARSAASAPRSRPTSRARRSIPTGSTGCRPLALEQIAREYTAKRFPSLADAPIVGSRVCQYELTGDTHFLFARHPERPSWWLLGGGSGHGFKHGPALAEYVADCIEGRREPEPFHALGPRTGNAGLRTAATG